MPSSNQLLVPETDIKPLVTIRVHLPDDPKNINKTETGPKLRKVQTMVLPYAGVHF
jgi:hypothetical protein